MWLIWKDQHFEAKSQVLHFEGRKRQFPPIVFCAGCQILYCYYIWDTDASLIPLRNWAMQRYTYDLHFYILIQGHCTHPPLPFGELTDIPVCEGTLCTNTALTFQQEVFHTTPDFKGWLCPTGCRTETLPKLMRKIISFLKFTDALMSSPHFKILM